MKTIKVLRSYYNNGKIKKHQYNVNVNNIDEYFDGVITSANVLAKTKKGEIDIQRTEKTLYINYLGIPNDSMIDAIMIIK